LSNPDESTHHQQYLGRGYTVMVGRHIKDLPTSKLGVDLEHDFEPQYVTIKGK